LLAAETAHLRRASIAQAHGRQNFLDALGDFFPFGYPEKDAA
jgi:hypothetical protein